MQNNTTVTVPPFYNMKFTNEDGTLTSEAKLYNDLLNQVVTNNFNQSLTPPGATTSQITAYNDSVNVGLGAIWYNTDMDVLQVKTAAGIKTIMTS